MEAPSVDRSKEVIIPQEWLATAGLSTFQPRSTSFRALSTEEWPTIVVPISTINVFRRNPGVANFEEARMMAILHAIAIDEALPPVQVHEAKDGRFDLADGFHRYHASVVLGFSALPVSVRPRIDIHAL